MNVDKSLGLLFPTFDGDRKHFARFRAELTRLNLPFAVHLDHCCPATKKLFQSHPLCVGSYCDDDPQSFFDESSRQSALNILASEGFQKFIHMDVDETLERDAPRKLRELAAQPGWDFVGMRVLNLWGDGTHHRADGPVEYGRREKMFNLESHREMRYYHPTIHAPKVLPAGREAVLFQSDIFVLHWGIMSHADAEEHHKRWETIYVRKVGGNPYGTYQYLMDPNVTPVLHPVPEGIL